MTVMPVALVTLIPLNHQVIFRNINTSKVVLMMTNTGSGIFPGFIVRNGMFQSISQLIFGNTCNGKTVNFQTDSANCGGCGWACPAGLSCVQGQCDLACDKGLDNCEYNCVDLKSDPMNCGSCGNVCSPTEKCCSGKCAGYTSDPANCGGCGYSCARGETCASGLCTGGPSCQNSCDKAEFCNNGVCTATLPWQFVEYDSTQGGDNPGYGAAATCPASDSQSCWIRMSVFHYIGYESSDVVSDYDHVELSIDTQNIPESVKTGIKTGTRKAYLVMHVGTSSTGTLNAINRDSSLWKIAYNTDNSQYQMFITDIPGGGNDYGGTETPPGQGSAVSGSRAHYDTTTKTVTVDITDIVKAWLDGSVPNRGLKLMPYSEQWPMPENDDDSSGLITYYDILMVNSVSADAPL
jgi:hypothetical protein